MFLRSREGIVFKVKRRVPYFDGECKRYTVDHPESERLTGWARAGSNFPMSATAAANASAAVDCMPEALPVGT
eukprot:3765148-Lingulodinium_polyedra.AAC.1